MKRREFLRHLERHGCILDREGRRHSIYRNSILRKGSLGTPKRLC